MSERERLPDRRQAESLDFSLDGRTWTATIGRFANGKIGELFLNSSKESAIVELARRVRDRRLTRLAARLSARSVRARAQRSRRGATRLRPRADRGRA